MGEAEAIKAIKRGRVKINGKEYTIHSQPSGCCDGCVFLRKGRCPQLALDICCTGGNILKHKK